MNAVGPGFLTPAQVIAAFPTGEPDKDQLVAADFADADDGLIRDGTLALGRDAFGWEAHLFIRAATLYLWRRSADDAFRRIPAVRFRSRPFPEARYARIQHFGRVKAQVIREALRFVYPESCQASFAQLAILHKMDLVALPWDVARAEAAANAGPFHGPIGD